MQQKEHVIYPLFATPLMGMPLAMDNKRIMKNLKKFKFRHTGKVTNSYRSIDNKVLDNSNFKKEKNIFEQAIKLFLEKLNYRQSFKILNSWITKTPKNSDCQSHVHPNSWISAVYYPESDFSIMFEKDDENFMYNVEYENDSNIFSSKTFKVSPKAGTILIFPSTLMHRIIKNTTKKDRYSIAFNVVPIGTFHKGGDAEITYV
tara:strand:+ start:42 stop:650 length:609 start_codon:yes stop_codon:yes gene_type:complete